MLRSASLCHSLVLLHLYSPIKNTDCYVKYNIVLKISRRCIFQIMKKTVSLIFFYTLVFPGLSEACTTFLLQKNGQMVFGKNYDWMTGTGVVHTNLRGLAKTSLPLDGGNIIVSYREAEASINNFHNLMLKTVEPKPEHPILVGGINELEFRNISFKHQSAQFKALDNISFDVKKGETIAFVGPSGAGKSTLVKLLVGLYRPQEGGIFYNGVSGQDLDFDELRGQIGFVTQDTQLFAGTIRENLLFVNPNATEEDLWDVLKKSSSTYLLSKAENGLDTLIGEGGLKLSGGEKQRLSIARSLLRHPHLLIFDEATSSLDSLTEEAITNTIKKVSSEREQITVLIAHRLSTIMHADRIYVLEKGRIAETGSHYQLLDEKGLYYAMWRQQIGERKVTGAAAQPVNLS